MVDGSPKCLIHPSVKAVVQALAVASGIGIASINRLVRSIQVNKYRIPSELLKGPTTSTVTSRNRGAMTGLGSSDGMIVFFG